jgi:Fic family protein
MRPVFEWSGELIQRLNATVMRDLENDERGEYRHDAVTVANFYHPPDWQRLPALMSELVEWLRNPTELHPLIRAGLTHLNVVSIHPWLDGNGRTARIAGSLMMMRCGIGAPELLNVESEFRASVGRYYEVLQETQGPTYQPSEHSATPWLEYFAQVCVARLDTRNRVLHALPADLGLLSMQLSQDRRASPEWPAILLGARMAPVRTSRLAATLGLSPARTRAMLSAMAAAGWLNPLGDRRGRRYGPSDRLLQLELRTPELMSLLAAGEPQEQPVQTTLPLTWTISGAATSSAPQQHFAQSQPDAQD